MFFRTDLLYEIRQKVVENIFDITGYWTSENDRFYEITFVRMYVWMYGCDELISETAPPIFLKLGMKLGDNKG